MSEENEVEVPKETMVNLMGVAYEALNDVPDGENITVTRSLLRGLLPLVSGHPDDAVAEVSKATMRLLLTSEDVEEEEEDDEDIYDDDEDDEDDV